MDPECTIPYKFGTPVDETNTVDGVLKIYGLWKEEVVLTGDNSQIYMWGILIL